MFKSRYLGGAIAADENLYCFPCDAERVLCVNTATDEVTTVGPEFLSLGVDGTPDIGLSVNKWQNGFCESAIPRFGLGGSLRQTSAFRGVDLT